MPEYLRRLVLLAALVVAGGTSAAASIDDKPWPSVEDLFEDHTVEQTAELRRMLWATPLGLLMSDYLDESGDAVATTARAHRITRRLLSSGPMLSGRIAAIHLLSEDLYENGKVDERTHLRLSQLDSEIAFKLHALQDHATGNFIWHSIIPLGIGVLAGSRPVREEALAATNAVLKRLGPFYSEKWAQEVSHSRAQLKSHFEHGKFLRHYSPVYAWTGFSAATAVYWTGYSFVETGVGEDESLVRHFVNYSLQSSTSIEYL